MRKPARQHPADQAEKPAVRADPDRRLRDRQSDQLRIRHKRWPTASWRDRVVVSEDIGCNDKGFQIRHLELLSRGDTWSGSPSSRKRGSLPTRVVSHQASRARKCPRVPDVCKVGKGRRHLQAFRGSPLTDSNRRPPPYHGGSGFCYTANKLRLLVRFPCNAARCSANRTPSSKRLEPSRKTLNLSPKPVPKALGRPVGRRRH